MSIHTLPCHILFSIPVLLFCTLQVRPLWRPSSACSRISALSGARSSSARRSSSSGSSGRSSLSSSTGCGSAIVREVRGGALAYSNESVFEERLFVLILVQGCGSGSAWIRFISGSWIRIRNRVKSLIWIRIEVKILKF
jgi:hypothetical protein